jgi:hypothetical protein
VYSTEGSGVGGSEKKNYLADSCTYTHTKHIVFLGNSTSHYLLLPQLLTPMNNKNIDCTCNPD